MWTARETREWIAERVPGQRSVLRKLTRDVERACYAREAPAPEEVNSIEQTANDVAQELRAHALPPSRERRPLR